MPRVYLDASVISYYTARLSGDDVIGAYQQTTRDWWRDERPKHELFVSRLVIAEISRGDEVEAEKRLRLIEDIPRLDIVPEAEALAKRFVDSRTLPPNAADDALHLAISVLHRIEFLLTWNCKHLANPMIRRKLDDVCRSAGHEPATICTPFDLLEFDDG